MAKTETTETYWADSDAVREMRRRNEQEFEDRQAYELEIGADRYFHRFGNR